MGKSVEIKCDGCGADLTTTGNCVDYRLALLVQRLPSGGGFVTAMMIYPPIENDAYFCDLGCLDKWRAAGIEKAAKRKAWWDAHKIPIEGWPSAYSYTVTEKDMPEELK